jgi:PEP-CTERM motif
MKLNAFASALVLSTAACLAQAGTAYVSQAGSPLNPVLNQGSLLDPYALGVLGVQPSSVFVTLTSPGSFEEYATLFVAPGFFSSEGASDTYALSISLPSGPLVIGSIDNFEVEVFGGTPTAPGTLFGAYAPGVTFGLPGTPAGDYFLRFSGTVNGVGAQYSAAMIASPVPEPSIYLMAALGLAVLAWRLPNARR